MDDSYANQLALSILMMVAAWAVTLLWWGSPAALAFACLLALASLAIFPPPP
jgi:hypothetical protein